MSLSCGCDADVGWHYYPASDYAPLATKRSRKCCSCGERIAVGDLSLKLERSCPPRNDIEERIYLDEVPLPSWYLCEDCADQYYNLSELGYCITLPDNLKKLVKEHAAIQQEYREMRKA